VDRLKRWRSPGEEEQRLSERRHSDQQLVLQTRTLPLEHDGPDGSLPPGEEEKKRRRE